MDLKLKLNHLKCDYRRACRCWQTNNLRSCLRICDGIGKQIRVVDWNELFDEVNSIKNLIWFLKIKCLAEDYYINESLLLNEDDIDSGNDEIRTMSAVSRHGTARSILRASTARASCDTIGRKMTTAGGSIETRQRTAVLTGSMSRHSSRATSSYRPLTTSLTATQTAFSRSTRPLLKYASCDYLSKPLYDYLYNAQTVTNKCPDYRQCLEFLNIVQNTSRANGQPSRNKKQKADSTLVVLDDDNQDERRALGAFWLISFGVCYFNLHMNKQAEEFFQLALELDPKHLDTYAWLVKVYLRTNQLSKVLKTCEVGLDNCKNALLYNWMARVQSLTCDSYAANANLRNSLKYYPTNVEALANVGYFCFYSDKLEQSLKCNERIYQISLNQSTNISSDVPGGLNSAAELLNNLALCNFYCGNYHKVMPLFQRALISSPSKEVTSAIWYNISFVPIGFGFKNLAVMCLKLALKNDSQNEEALNNLGVLKYSTFINDHLHYENRQELWATSGQPKRNSENESELENSSDYLKQQALFDEIETYFSLPMSSSDVDNSEELNLVPPPEMLYNTALVKRQRGHLLGSVKYCKFYLESDPNNYTIKNLLKEINQIVSHDC